MEKHFDKQTLQEQLDAKLKPQEIVLDKIGRNADFKVVFLLCPLEPEKNRFEFYGKRSDEILTRLLTSAPTLDELLANMHEIFPMMDPYLWGEYEVLLKEVEDCIRESEYRRNKETLCQEEYAIKALCDFCIEHHVG